MSTYKKKRLGNKNKTIAKRVSQMQNHGKSTFQLIDNRPETVIQKKQIEALANETLTARTIQKKGNNTGLPNHLKTGIENLSGYSMDDVKVHYNSNKPAQLHAHAYAQGTDIHLASGQEKHLPHEAWHVVQQKQGRVKPTMQMKGNVNINDDKVLEKEADTMGEKALQLKTKVPKNKTAIGAFSPNRNKEEDRVTMMANSKPTQLVVQRNRTKLLETLGKAMKGLAVHPKRLAYMNEAKKGYSDAQFALQQIAAESYSASTHDLHYAKVFNTWRRNLGEHYKDITPPTLREVIYERNTKKYDDKLGPTTERLLKTKSPIDIIISATRPNNDVGGTLMRTIEKLELPENTLEKLIEEVKTVDDKV